MSRRRAIGLLLLIALSGGCADQAGPDKPQSQVPSSHTSAPAHGEDAHQDTSTPPPTDHAAQVVTRFAHAWVQTSVDARTWWEGVAPWCEEGLADKLRSVEPANVPARTITGPPTPVGGSAAEGLRFQIATDVGTLHTTVAALGGQWKVTTIDFDRSRQ